MGSRASESWLGRRPPLARSDRPGGEDVIWARGVLAVAVPERLPVLPEPAAGGPAAQARATLTQAQSNLSFTEADFTRGQQLVKEKTITEQTFEQRSQAYRNAQASVSGAEAAVRSAELDLEFTELRAPISGRSRTRRAGGVARSSPLAASRLL